MMKKNYSSMEIDIITCFIRSGIYIYIPIICSGCELYSTFYLYLLLLLLSRLQIYFILYKILLNKRLAVALSAGVLV
jgi:hypothetical protein